MGMLDGATNLIVMLGFAALLAGAFAIALSGFSESTTNTTAKSIIANGTRGISNFVEPFSFSFQLPDDVVLRIITIIVCVVFAIGALLIARTRD